MLCGAAAMVASNLAEAQLAPQYASMALKDAYYLNGDYKALRSVLKNDQRVADAPAIRIAGEDKPANPRDLVLILDELAELHTYLDPHQEQVYSLNRRIRTLLQTDLASAQPSYATRYSFLSQLPRIQAVQAPDLNQADLRLLGERVDHRERYFRERLLAQRPESTGIALADVVALWNGLPAKASSRHRLVIARRVAQAAVITDSNKSTLGLAPVLSNMATDPALGLREKIEAALLAAYFDTLSGNAAQVVSRYQSVSGMVSQEIGAEQTRRRERAEQFESLSRQNREFLEKKQANKTLTSVLVTVATMVVAAKIGFKTPEQAQSFGNSVGSGMRSFNELTSLQSHQETWSSSAIATELNRNLAALRVLHRYIDIPLILELMPPLIDAHAAQGKNEEVLAMADIYFGYANEIRGSTYDAGSREAFQAKMEDVFRAAVSAAFAIGKVDALLELSESYSSHILLDAIVSGRTRLDSVDPAAMASGGSTEALTNFVKLADAKPMKKPEIVAYLKDRGITMVRLFEMGDRLGILFAGSDGVRIVSEKLPPGEVARLSRNVVNLLRPENSEKNGRAEMAKAVAQSPVGRFLSTHLFVGVEPLLVIPSKGLSDFPFSALTDAGSAAAKYLIEQRPLIQHLSASIAKAIGSRNDRAKGQFLSLGNPALVMKYAGQETLPAAENESRDAAAMMQGKSYIGNDATQEVLLSALRDNGIVHVAAHGVFNAKEPLDSRLVVPSSDKRIGDLSALRLYGHGIKASTVLLSACSLGRGGITKGNEVNGFIRPLLMQSTRNIMTNLWEVDDDGAYAVTMSILKRVKAGQEMPVAFQEGIKAVIADPQYASPYYWSPFVLFAAR